MKKTKISLMLDMILFGSIGLIVRYIPYHTSQIAMVRGVLGCLFLFILSLLLKQKLSWKRIKPNLWILVVSGTAIGLNWIFLFQAYRYTTISNATICYYFAPVFIMFLSPVVLKERLNTAKICCILSAVIGMFCIFAREGTEQGHNHIIGILYGLTAAVFYAAVVILNKFLKNVSNMEISMIQLAVSAAALFPYVLLNDGSGLGRMLPAALSLLMVLGIVHTGIAYFIYFSAIQKLNGQTIAVFSYMDPISAIVLSWLFLHERMSGLQIVGGVLILGGAFYNEITNRKTETEG